MTTTKTFTPRADEIERRWYVVDATGQTLGRLASRIAVSGDKRESKIYYRHSGHPGGLRAESLGRLLDRRPEEVIRRAVRGMLPHNRLGAEQLRHLKVYAGSEHPHQSQRPEPLVIEEAREA